MEHFEVFINAILNTANWVWSLILFEVPWYKNYFYGLIVISLLVWLLEYLFPWRKNQKIIRKDFWLDGFYMFFNFFLFSIAISGFYALSESLFKEIGIGMSTLALLNIEQLPVAIQLLIFFILSDFVQWLTHIALHRFPILWNFHKVHHSVQEMGFAAHLRYHWMENILYKPLKVFVVMLIGGYEPSDAFIIHFISITIGHLNHANIKLSYGPLKYLFNNPIMHLYHHARFLPKERRYGVNFGISLSIWDYIFKTNYVPEDSGTIELGFEKLEEFPEDFIGQNTYGFGKKND